MYLSENLIMKRYNISFAGAGRVGSAVCTALYSAGHKILKVVSETSSRGIPLAESCKAEWSHELIFPDDTEIIIVAVPDHRLITVLQSLKCSDQTLVVHTAGSFGQEVFPGRMVNTGVFYPLQTFTSGRNIEFAGLPFLTEANNKNNLKILDDLAISLGSGVYHAGSEERTKLHLAAVIACNFSNYLLSESKIITEKAGFSFDILKPLIEETISKAFALSPENSQTGPAVRNDFNTMEKHLGLLSYSPQLQKIYSDISESIINFYKK